PPCAAAADDGELLAAFAGRRDEAAFAELVRRHGPLVLGVCRRVLGDTSAAEDAFQATFLLLVRKAPVGRWRPSLGPWLYAAAGSRAAAWRQPSAYSRRPWRRPRCRPVWRKPRSTPPRHASSAGRWPRRSRRWFTAPGRPTGRSPRWRSACWSRRARWRSAR